MSLSQAVWIGGSDASTEGVWAWDAVDGGTLDDQEFENWLTLAAGVPPGVVLETAARHPTGPSARPPLRGAGRMRGRASRTTGARARTAWPRTSTAGSGSTRTARAGVHRQEYLCFVPRSAPETRRQSIPSVRVGAGARPFVCEHPEAPTGCPDGWLMVGAKCYGLAGRGSRDECEQRCEDALPTTWPAARPGCVASPSQQRAVTSNPTREPAPATARPRAHAATRPRRRFAAAYECCNWTPGRAPRRAAPPRARVTGPLHHP